LPFPVSGSGVRVVQAPAQALKLPDFPPAFDVKTEPTKHGQFMAENGPKSQPIVN
jgi:hypothetical protein